jgi:hypothetical protein
MRLLYADSVVAEDLQHAEFSPPESSYVQTALGVTGQLQVIVLFVSGNIFLSSEMINFWLSHLLTILH